MGIEYTKSVCDGASAQDLRDDAVVGGIVAFELGQRLRPVQVDVVRTGAAA
jgi:hypothetical protein